jgi:hypothetical protein
MDFTFKILRQLLQSLKAGEHQFISVSDHLHDPSVEKFILLRHDVEKHYENALEFAKMENEMGMRGTYYFRFSKKHFNAGIVAEIASLEHEIGYHYDDLSKCRGNTDLAIERFKKNLGVLRQIATVETICMDGSPLSKYDNKDLWKKYNYKDLGLTGEPYFDIDFSKVGYLTDTGRRWDGEKVSVRDKVKTGERRTKTEHDEILNSPPPVGGGREGAENRGTKTEDHTILNSPPPVGGGREGAEDRKSKIEHRTSTQHLSSTPESRTSYHTTNDIIEAAQNGQLPDQLMLTFHPQRWTDKPLPWVKELVWQNLKNQVKRLIVKQ